MIKLFLLKDSFGYLGCFKVHLHKIAGNSNSDWQSYCTVFDTVLVCCLNERIVGFTPCYLLKDFL